MTVLDTTRCAEEKAGLPDVPPETCPIINAVIEAIQSVEKICSNQQGRWRRGPQFESVEEMASCIETELSDCRNNLEIIRKHNATLRDLGQTWYEIARIIESEEPHD